MRDRTRADTEPICALARRPMAPLQAVGRPYAVVIHSIGCQLAVPVTRLSRTSTPAAQQFTDSVARAVAAAAAAFDAASAAAGGWPNCDPNRTLSPSAHSRPRVCRMSEAPIRAMNRSRRRAIDVPTRPTVIRRQRTAIDPVLPDRRLSSSVRRPYQSLSVFVSVALPCGKPVQPIEPVGPSIAVFPPVSYRRRCVHNGSRRLRHRPRRRHHQRRSADFGRALPLR